MFNSVRLFIYRAITPLHCGAAEGGGVDLPVARERFTNFPIIPSSSLKGVWRDVCRSEWKKDDELTAFGPEPEFAERDRFDEKEAEGESSGKGPRHYAGCLAFVDAYPLFLPVRSSVDVFLMITCPLQVRRFAEACTLAGAASPFDGSDLPQPDNDQIFRLGGASATGKTYLEDLELDTRSHQTVTDMPGLLPHIRKRLALVSDETFKWFATNALEIRAHNQLDPKTKESKNLWYEEAVPVEALFFAPVFSAPPRNSGGNGNDGTEYITRLLDTYKKQGFFQIGGHETTGRGLMEIVSHP